MPRAARMPNACHAGGCGGSNRREWVSPGMAAYAGGGNSLFRERISYSAISVVIRSPFEAPQNFAFFAPRPRI